MWVYQYQPLLNGLLQKALVELCTQSLPWEGRLEIDGIFCVSGKDPSQQIVIKIHKALEKPEPRNMPKQNRNVPPGKTANKKVLIEAGKIVSTSSSGNANSRKKSPNRKGNMMPLNLSLPNLKSGASVTQHGMQTHPGLQKSMTVGNQSLRALLGTKAAEGSVTSYSGDSTATDDRAMTILKQPHPTWLKKEGEDVKKEQDTGSETGSEKKDFYPTIKEEPMDLESESSLDLDEETLPATNVTCKICAIDFESFKVLQAHTLEMHKRHACRQCCNTFSLRCNLRRHERLHAGVKPHACSYCKKSFSRSADLKAHLRKHAAEKIPDWISCSKCPKSFRNAVNLRLHMYKVHKEKDCVYACSICEKVFHDADEFQIHRESHTASLVHAGRAENDSACSTPVVNGSQDSMDEDGAYSDGADSDDLINYGEMDHLVNSATAKEDFIEELSRAKSSQLIHRQVQALSKGHLDDGSQGSDSAQGNDEELRLYFGSPLVIKEENDSNDGDFMKRSNRRKSKPSKVVASEPIELEDDTENLEPHLNAISEHESADQGTSSLGRLMKRDPTDDDSGMLDAPDYKRPRIQPEMLLGESFGMADQSLEAIMKQVNENLYKNKDVNIAEEQEKEIEKKGKSKSSKGKNISANRKGSARAPITSTPNAKNIVPKPPIVLLVSSNQSGGLVTPKVAIPSTPNPLKMNFIKQEASASWSVSPKVRPKRDGNTSFSPIPQELFLKASKDADTKDYTCSQWGCNFFCNGFQAFEDHTLTLHGRYPCKFCSQTFTGRNNRTRHIRYHMTGKQHQCNDCGKFFARPDSLKEHRFIHTKSYRDSKCCNCLIYFEKKATLLSHMKKCFSDDQLVTDKLTPEEIEREANLKKEPKDTSLNKTRDKEAIAALTPPQPKVPSDVGVMKAEYLQKEKQKIMDVKNYLDTQMAAMETVLDAAASPADRKTEEDDDVTVIDLDAKSGAKAAEEKAETDVLGLGAHGLDTDTREMVEGGEVMEEREMMNERTETMENAEPVPSEPEPSGPVPSEPEPLEPLPSLGFASSLISNMAQAAANADLGQASEGEVEQEEQVEATEAEEGVGHPKDVDTMEQMDPEDPELKT